MKAVQVTKISLILIVGLVSILLAACGSNSTDNQVPNHAATALDNSSNGTSETEGKEEKAEVIKEPFEVTDQVGNKVSIPATVQKVYAPGLEDYLVSLGITPIAQWSSGTSPQKYLEQELNGVKEISFANGVPSPESVVDMEPDLIIFPTAFYAQNGVYENYSKIAPTYVFNNALGDVEGTAEIIAQLLGLEEKAEELVSEYHAKFSETKEKLASVSAGKQAIYINANAKAIFLVGNLHYGGYVLSELGFAQNPLVEGKPSANISLEMLPDIDADYIFINNNDGLGDSFLAEIKGSPIWSSLPAVQADQVYNVEGDHWRSSGLIAYENIMDDILEFLQ